MNTRYRALRGRRRGFPAAPGPRIKELSEEYLEIRNAQMRANAEREQIALEEKLGTLISRQLAGSQAAYLLTVFRQRVLAAPVEVARRLVAAGIVAPEREHDTAQLLREAACAQLAELSELPGRSPIRIGLRKLTPISALRLTGANGRRRNRHRLPSSRRRPSGRRFVASGR